jgi:hypothetical protein
MPTRTLAQIYTIHVEEREGAYSVEVTDNYGTPIIPARDLSPEKVEIPEAIAFYASYVFRREGLQQPSIEEALKLITVHKDGDELTTDDLKKILSEYWQN